MPQEPLPEASAFGMGGAFADLSFWRKIAVSGSEALGWLDDLVTADLSGMQPGRARGSLLLSPTGRIRAAFTVAWFERDLLLVQDPQQPKPIDALLAPYVLSSDVRLEDRTNAVALFAFPGGTSIPEEAAGLDVSVSSPSCLGEGTDLLARADDHERVLASLRSRFRQVGNEVVESWQISSGHPRFGVDALEEDLPQEAGLSGLVSFDKGCYLGQEAVAKVQNLGHPRRLVVPLVASAPVSAGDPIVANDADVGEITSVAPGDGQWFVLGRVKWEAREGPYSTSAGTELSATGIS